MNWEISKYKLGIATIAIVTWSVSFAQTPVNQNDWRAWLQKARKHYQDKSYNEALQAYENALLGLPKQIDISGEIAQTHYRLNQLEEAQQWYGRPQKQEAIHSYNAGNAAYKQKNFKEAIRQYKKALKSNPELAQARYNLTMAMREERKSPTSGQTPPNQPPQQPKKNDSGGNLPDNTVDRMLNQLARKEADTRQKIQQNQNQTTHSSQRKNW